MPPLELSFALFASISVAIFWTLPEKGRPIGLALLSSGFLGFLDVHAFVLIVSLTTAVYALAARARGARRRWIVGLLTLIAVFATAKAVEALGHKELLPAIAVPLGFAYAILKLIHYWIESDMGDLPEHSFLDFYNYMLFFPTLLVGPIHRVEPFLRGERRRRWDSALFSDGLRRVLYGYAKVVVLANWLVGQVLRSHLFSQSRPGTGLWVLEECLVYGLYLYFAFAGLSEIGIGLAKLFGQSVGENFRHPFLQRNIADFWRSWHISLGNWCRDYVFTPFLARWRSPGIAMLLTMLCIGVWHEFTARYVLWGLYHGIGLVLHRRFAEYATRFPKPRSAVGRATSYGVSAAATFVFVMVGFAITKNSAVSATFSDFKALLVGWHG